jgi:hypothetical protein
LTKHVQLVIGGLGGLNNYSRWFWWALYLRVKVERYMDLEISLVEKQDEEVKEGVDLGSEWRSTPYRKVEKNRRSLVLRSGKVSCG